MKASERTRPARAGEPGDVVEVRCDECDPPVVVVAYAVPFDVEGLPPGLDSEGDYVDHVLARHGAQVHPGDAPPAPEAPEPEWTPRPARAPR